MVELVTSIVIIGTLAAAIGPKLVGNRVLAERGYADELAAALRYAQSVAVASGCGVAVTLAANNYQALQPANGPPACSGNWNRAITRVDGGALMGAAPNGVVLAPATQIVFDDRGHLVGGPPPVLNAGGFTLTIDRFSGFVVVQ